MISRLANKNVLITGASSGIGLSCARLFAKEQSNLILTARRLDRLQALRTELCSAYPNIKVHVSALDVADRKQVFDVIHNLPEHFTSIDLLVNNAGRVLGMDHVADVKPEQVEAMFDTNVKGLLNVTQAILPGMKERNKGHIINIGSVAGREAYAGGGIYCATKHAVEAISKSLRQELISTKINVSLISPGLVNTEFSTVRFGGDKSMADAVYKGMTPLTGDDIAEIIVFTASRPPHVQIADLLVFPSCQSSVSHVHREQ